MIRWILTITILAALAPTALAERVKDIVELKGVRSNVLQGYGLVVGLAGTGDNSPAAKRMLSSILRRQKLVIEPTELDSKNIAAVFVRADLGPFSSEGSRIDVTVSCIGNATSLRGGNLLMTPLIGADDQVHAIAEGRINVGGFTAGGDSASVTKNHTTAGIIAEGATVEKEEKATFVEAGEITLLLRNADFTTAKNIADAVNTQFPNSAVATDAGAITVTIPREKTKAQITDFVNEIGKLNVKVDFPAVVVIDEKTGTIVIGENVMVSLVAISKGSLSIMTKTTESVSQPGPLSNTGQTAVVKNADTKAIEAGGTIRVVPPQISVADLARALNAMGVSPSDLGAIFQSIKAAGGLQATIKSI